MAIYNLNINGVVRSVTAEISTPLLWALRDLGLTGTKYGCGIEKCHACLVWIDGSPEEACDEKVSEVVGKRITTIEGLSSTPEGRAIQQAFIDEQVPQCGFCQSGMLMAAAKIVRNGGTIPAGEDGLENICACGTYPRVLRAIDRAVANL